MAHPSLVAIGNDRDGTEEAHIVIVACNVRQSIKESVEGDAELRREGRCGWDRGWRREDKGRWGRVGAR